MTHRVFKSTAAVAAGIFILSACSVAPIEDRPGMEVPASFLQADHLPSDRLMPTEEPGRWHPAEPADQQVPSPWWTIFGDPALVRLEEEALKANPDVARTYFSLRQLESEHRLLRDTVALREDAAALLERKLGVGIVAGHVVDQARAELFSARSEQQAVEQQRALASHALSTLLGKSPAAFSLDAKPLENVTVQLPPGMPSTLLERRPDIAAAERAMAAEDARIGVAKASFFPSLSLTGSLGQESADLGNLAHWTQRTFLLGPLAGTALGMPIFDGGRRKADLARARGVYEERVAAYRKAVLQAFREVEDSLLSLRSLDERIVHQRSAEEASSRVARSARSRFDEGDVDHLVPVEAERTLLRSRQALVQAEGDRARATVDLVLALGGGWDGPSSGSNP